MNFVEELRWRGMLQDIMPGSEEQLEKEVTTGYIGFDPTADSLHVGSLVQIMMLTHFQKAGHKPIALIGGATGMIGDPSGKKEERKLQTYEDVKHNQECIKKQLEKFLVFDGVSNPAKIVNNADWFNSIHTITFLREVGKFLSVNYLLSKGFVKDRLSQEQELSFTEFNYILMQAYDFLWLYENENCKIQMGGSDQWGNITAGSDLIRKKIRGNGFAITCPLMTKADGTKFGKTETGNVWLDARKTSPYKFYQFWLNAADADAENYIKIFSVKKREEIEAIIAKHKTAPHERLLQKELAHEITVRVHSVDEYDAAVEASEILFGNSTAGILKKVSEENFLAVFEGVPQKNISRSLIENGVPVIDMLSEHSGFLKSKSEAKRALQEHSISVNKEKASEDLVINTAHLINNKYLLLQRGKKNYFLIIAEG